jgi:hypothetical protein
MAGGGIFAWSGDVISGRISGLEIKSQIIHTSVDTVAHWHESKGDRRARRIRVVPPVGVTTTQEKFKTGRGSAFQRSDSFYRQQPIVT